MKRRCEQDYPDLVEEAGSRKSVEAQSYARRVRKIYGQIFAAVAEFRGAFPPVGVTISKSFRLLFVSVQPEAFRRAAVVVLRFPVGLLPSA